MQTCDIAVIGDGAVGLVPFNHIAEQDGFAKAVQFDMQQLGRAIADSTILRLLKLIVKRNRFFSAMTRKLMKLLGRWLP